jgi:hypothetical protein
MSHHDRDVEIVAFLRNKGVTRCPTACVVPPKARLASPIKRRSQSMQLPANCCGRKAQLDGKFSALCEFGIKPGYRSCQRDLGVLGNHPAVQNMLLAARAFSSRRKPRPLSACRPGVHSYALLPIGYPMGRFGPVRRVALSDVVCEDRWGQPYRDLSRRQTGDVLF